MKADGRDALGGIQASVIDMRGFSSVAICYHGFASEGWSGRDLLRFRRLGALVISLQLPRAACADWKIATAILQAKGFVDKVQRRVLTASDTAITCTASARGSEIDCALASSSFGPYVLGIDAKMDVPWETHCGLLMSFRGAANKLLARPPEMPSKLPQARRPSSLHSPGSKPSRAKDQRLGQQEAAGT